MSNLKEKYNLVTAISCVVGIVIGTGIFFKTGEILKETNGNFWLSILAWVIGGVVMLVCCYNFATISLHNKEVNNITGFAKVTVGKRYSYYVSCFIKNIYLPAMTSAVSFIASMYTFQLFNTNIDGFPFCIPVFVLAGVYIVLLSLLNMFAPIIAGKFQVSTTVIKMIPLLLMAIVGTIVGLTTGLLQENATLAASSEPIITGGSGLFAAICVTSFSYEGWICATNIGEEIKDRHKNLPKAMILGTLIVMLIYIVYNIGIAGVLPVYDLATGGSNPELITSAFTKLFGKFSSVILNVIIVISALGTLNGLVMTNSRSSYILASEKEGFAYNYFSKVNEKFNTPVRSAVLGLILTLGWLVYFYFSQTNSMSNGKGFPFSSDELPIITTYLLYIPMFIAVMLKDKTDSKFKRYVMPFLGVASSILMIIAAIYRHQINTLWYLIFFIVFMLGAFLLKLYNDKRKKELANV